MPVTIDRNDPDELTTFSLSGKVKLPELVGALERYGRSGPTRYELYDLGELTGERLSSADIRSLIDFFRKYPNIRPPESKTAILVASDIDFGIGRMISILSDGQVPFKIEVFRSLDQALNWLRLE
ncbi:STAS/SEC14 domain-containing protein [uncultured Desulfosarcina sp.]|uniref:STAS/SEC14 domain-containing protein n=1 Tax=uncultured Desulfosarcina sp. TaxID=218289 RepID=UPI0029C73EBB|nr:STAS/SEC14 domain-containing protein [uncultured Desulfosarcina sp.]